jgi:beta-galactosidase
MKIGTYYYPEQWPCSQWERDFANIASHGFKIVHMAEFAWLSLEPRPGEYSFGWLDECVALAKKHKLEVILCTPTAVPPVWLAVGKPETLLVDQAGVRQRHGGRRHYSPTSSLYIEESRKIAAAMGQHYASEPAVIGWQIDNEYSSSGVVFDQSPETHALFREWLKERYKTIDGLNHAWGTQFWNTQYEQWDQILLPASRDPGYGNPHQRLDASRFWSYAWARYNRFQVEELKKSFEKRPASMGRPWITTNFMPFHPDANPADMAGDFDLTTWDSYPLTGWEKSPKDECFRIADPDHICLNHDTFASYHRRWALMEVQPGQVNWSGYPVLPYPGAVRLWLWTAIALGAEFITVYRWKQPLWGVEMFHAGLVTTDGVTLSTGGRQFAQVIEELKRLDAGRVPALADEPVTAETVGLIIDFEQQWWATTLPQAKRWAHVLQWQQWHGAITKLGLRVRVLRVGEEIPAGMKLVVAAGLQMIEDSTVAQLAKFAEAGGHVLMTARSGLMNRHGQLWEGPWAMPILKLIGATIEAYDSLPEGAMGKVKMEKQVFEWGAWGDLLYPGDGTKTLAEYADQFYAGAAAVTQTARGKGTVTYCGVAGEQPLCDAVVGKLARQLKLRTEVMENRVKVVRRGPYAIALNYDDKAHEVTLPAGAKVLLGSGSAGKLALEPAGVAIWEV